MPGMDEPGFEILYESGPCVAVLKPPGLLTQAPPGIDSLEARAKAFFRRRDKPEGGIYLGVVHRLDRPASGVMLLGLTRRATRRMARQFEERRVRKTYWAYVEGRVTPESGTWTDTLRKVPGEARAEVVDADHPDGRTAVLHYRVLQAADRGSWLEIELETGRTHQIRVQAATRDHPALGDAQYGATTPFGTQYEDDRLRAIALHARSLTFEHPKAHNPVTVTAPLSEDWQGLGLDLEGKL